MTEELVTFETAKLAKEKGFDEECMNYWEWYLFHPPMEPLAHGRPLVDFREISKDMWEKSQIRPGLYNSVYHPMKNSNVPPFFYARPTQDLLERWIREVHRILIECIFAEGKGWEIQVAGLSNGNETRDCFFTNIYSRTLTAYPTHVQAREVALKIALNQIQ